MLPRAEMLPWGKAHTLNLFVYVHQAVAVKKFDRGPLACDPQRNHSFEKEVTLFNKINHPNVVRLFGVKTEAQCHLLIMELADGDLLGAMTDGPLPEAEARAYFRHVVAAVQHCHALNICHRDLKLENVVIMPVSYLSAPPVAAHANAPGALADSYGSCLPGRHHSEGD